jgi:hypothetical protein
MIMWGYLLFGWGLWAALFGELKSRRVATVWLSFALGVGLCVTVVMFGSAVGQGMTATFGLMGAVTTGESELLQALENEPDYAAWGRQHRTGSLLLLVVVGWNGILWRGEHVRKRKVEADNTHD